MRRVAGFAVAFAVAFAPAVWAQVGKAKKAEDEKQSVAADTGAAADAVQLFNGQDFEGWKLFIPDENVDPKTVWEIRDGVIHCKGKPAGYMRTTTEYENYKLTFEWRWPEGGGNSGLLMHIQGEDKVWPKSIEGQLMSRNAADFYVIDGTEFKEHIEHVKAINKPDERRVPKKTDSNEKPLGEWNTYEAVCDGNTIKLYVNGLLQNEATDANVSKGYIGLQSEGTPIEFRNIVLESLKK
ncbi:MAG: hypothetical protein AMXMBFR4_28470 [Candidatus Hydrogenedentota bacterium]